MYINFDCFSVVSVPKTKETRECVSGVERVHVDHSDRRQWIINVSVQPGVVCYTELSKERRKYGLRVLDNAKKTPFAKRIHIIPNHAVIQDLPRGHELIFCRPKTFFLRVFI